MDAQNIPSNQSILWEMIGPISCCVLPEWNHKLPSAPWGDKGFCDHTSLGNSSVKQFLQSLSSANMLSLPPHSHSDSFETEIGLSCFDLKVCKGIHCIHYQSEPSALTSPALCSWTLSLYSFGLYPCPPCSLISCHHDLILEQVESFSALGFSFSSVFSLEWFPSI